MSEYRATIGIEIHVQLATRSKMFCACDNDSVDAAPNTNVCPICLGYPGTLPLPNRHAVELAIRLGHGLQARIREFTKFDRKNYFYPDNPKGYQITQFDQPIIEDGFVEIYIDGEFRRIGIERAHLEEDAGKLVHPAGKPYSLLDLNRAGTPLLEIVSRPDMHTPLEAKRYLQEIYAIATTLGVTQGDMQHGNMKFDLNVSVSSTDQLGTRTELKNLNSFRNAERALNYEIKRQIDVLSKGGVINQETRGWDDAKGKTVAQRSKEEAHDYRYFPEPDIPPLVITQDMRDEQAKFVSVLPIEVRRELAELGLNIDEQDVLIGQPATAQLFAEARKLVPSDSIKKVVNWLVGDYQAWCKQASGDEIYNVAKLQPRFSSEELADLVRRQANGEITTPQAKQIFSVMCARGGDPAAIIQELGLEQISDTGELTTLIERIIASHPQAVADFRAGNAKALSFFIGQVMQETRGQANPQVVSKLVRSSLEQS